MFAGNRNRILFTSVKRWGTMWDLTRLWAFPPCIFPIILLLSFSFDTGDILRHKRTCRSYYNLLPDNMHIVCNVQSKSLEIGVLSNHLLVPLTAMKQVVDKKIVWPWRRTVKRASWFDLRSFSCSNQCLMNWNQSFFWKFNPRIFQFFVGKSRILSLRTHFYSQQWYAKRCQSWVRQSHDSQNCKEALSWPLNNQIQPKANLNTRTRSIISSASTVYRSHPSSFKPNPCSLLCYNTSDNIIYFFNRVQWTAFDLDCLLAQE